MPKFAQKRQFDIYIRKERKNYIGYDFQTGKCDGYHNWRERVRKEKLYRVCITGATKPVTLRRKVKNFTGVWQGSDKKFYKRRGI